MLILVSLCGLTFYLRGRSAATAQRLETELTTVVRSGGRGATDTEAGKRRGPYQSGDRTEIGPGKRTVGRRAHSTNGKFVEDEVNDSRTEMSGESNP